MISRRGLLLGLTSALAAPAIVHAGNLMPIKIFAERVWQGDIFYSMTRDVSRIALADGYSDQIMWWHDLTRAEALAEHPRGFIVHDYLTNDFTGLDLHDANGRLNASIVGRRVQWPFAAEQLSGDFHAGA